MAKRKQGSGATMGFGPSKKPALNVFGVLKTFLFVCALGAVLAGFAFLDRYVKTQNTAPSEGRTIELVGEIPPWVSEEIKNRILAAVMVRPFGLAQGGHSSPQAADANTEGTTENTAATIQRSIERQVPWLADVRVQTTHNSICIAGRWRKPIAQITTGPSRPTNGRAEASKNKFFIDADLVVLDYIPVGNLSVVTVDGLEYTKHQPKPGEICQGDDLAAALAVLGRMERMDSAVCPNKPLLREIDRIDVSNYNGRQKKQDPHIVLYTKDNTQIIWGAEIGAWQRHLESPDDDKLAKLYTYYQQYGTLSGVKYINLRDPRQTIYLPVDKY